jgi:hypothetical protein
MNTPKENLTKLVNEFNQKVKNEETEPLGLNQLLFEIKNNLEGESSLTLSKVGLLMTDIQASSLCSKIYFQEHGQKIHKLEPILDQNGIPINPEISLKILVLMAQSASMYQKSQTGYLDAFSRYTGDGFDMLCASENEFKSALEPLLVCKLLLQKYIPKLQSNISKINLMNVFAGKKLDFRIFYTIVKNLQIRSSKKTFYFQGENYDKAFDNLKKPELDGKSEIRVDESFFDKKIYDLANKIWKKSSNPKLSVSKQIALIVYNFREFISGAKIYYQSRNLKQNKFVVPCLYDSNHRLEIEKSLFKIATKATDHKNYEEKIDLLPMREEILGKVIEGDHVANSFCVDIENEDIFIKKIEHIKNSGINISICAESPSVILEIYSPESRLSTVFLLGWPTQSVNKLYKTDFKNLNPQFKLGLNMIISGLQENKEGTVENILSILINNPDQTAASRPFKSNPKKLLKDEEFAKVYTKLKKKVSDHKILDLCIEFTKQTTRVLVLLLLPGFLLYHFGYFKARTYLSNKKLNFYERKGSYNFEAKVLGEKEVLNNLNIEETEKIKTDFLKFTKDQYSKEYNAIIKRLKEVSITPEIIQKISQLKIDTKIISAKSWQKVVNKLNETTQQETLSQIILEIATIIETFRISQNADSVIHKNAILSEQYILKSLG